jgi:L-threonylcarbamoyladenylate synthase
MFENEKFDEILTVLRNGGSILLPTDTLWGVACDATNDDAVEKINRIKNRSKAKGYILLVDSVETLRQYVNHIHPRVETLLALHQRPVSIIYEKGIGIAASALAKDGSVAIRVVQDAFCRELLRQFGKPIVATSANEETAKVPTHFGEISSDILEKVDLVVKYKQDARDLDTPSVIARLNEYEELDFIRE